MRNIILISFLFLGAGNLSAQGIQFFEGSYSEALEKAADEGKLVFIDCYTTWCGPCKWMSAEVFTVEEVGTFFNTHFINVKMDMEKGEGRAMAGKFQIRGYPTLIIIDPSSGEEVDRALGAQRVDPLLSMGKKAIK
ncbi:MAG: thioredoxin family protein [Saprospiraceae bacterium]|nr:thioredoxin family protein [Saprospiraceae bacterium]